MPYTPEERAEIERLNLEEAEAVRRRWNGEEFDLALFQKCIAKERRKISRRARRRVMEMEENQGIAL